MLLTQLRTPVRLALPTGLAGSSVHQDVDYRDHHPLDQLETAALTIHLGDPEPGVEEGRPPRPGGRV